MTNTAIVMRMFSATQENSITAHVWLDKNSADNVIIVGKDESVIDEGADNDIENE